MLDWKPETRSLYRRLKKAGFEPVGVDDRCGEGPERPKSEDHALDVLTACDESTLTIKRNGERFALYLVYGNSPGELVCDYTYRDTQAGKELNAVTTAHYEAWEGRKQPTT